MPQRQSHRGRHPEDAKLFSEKWVPTLQEAASDFSFLLTRGYAEKAALKLVGDHYQLATRQRHAIQRAACSNQSLRSRRAGFVSFTELQGRAVSIDGYNLLITIESVLSQGVLIRGRDGCIRDLSSIHGSYHRVDETLPAIHLVGEILCASGAVRICWYFDAPVSNSGRLKRLLAREAEARSWNWFVELENNPDAVLAKSDDVVVTTDGWILDRAARWTDLTNAVIERLGGKCLIIDLTDERR